MTIEAGPWRGNVQPIRERDEPQLGWISPARYQGEEPPRQQWMVDGCFAKATVGGISGNGGVGKSTLCLQLACAAACGAPWLDLKVMPGRVLYLSYEDDNSEIWRRVYAISKYLNVEMADIGENFLWWPVIGQRAKLIYFEKFTREPKPTQWYEILKQKALEFGAQYIIVDTALKAFPGNQNDDQLVDDFIILLLKLALKIQGLVLFTRHVSMSGRADGTGGSGSVAWENSIRSRLYFTTNAKTAKPEIRGMKNNYGRLLDPIPLRYHVVHHGKGVYVRDESPLQRYLGA
jgi:RecA-family ATPase